MPCTQNGRNQRRGGPPKREERTPVGQVSRRHLERRALAKLCAEEREKNGGDSSYRISPAVLESLKSKALEVVPIKDN